MATPMEECRNPNEVDQTRFSGLMTLNLQPEVSLSKEKTGRQKRPGKLLQLGVIARGYDTLNQASLA